MDRRYVCDRGAAWKLRGTKMDARERLPVVGGDVHRGGEGRPPRDSEVADCKWVPLPLYAHDGGCVRGRARRAAAVGNR